MTIVDNKPIFLQIADGLMDRIAGGVYPPGERLPSVREQAANNQVNANTVLRAYEVLERDGIIYNKRGIGFFADPDARERIAERRKREFNAGEREHFFARLQQMGITPETLMEEYQKYLKSKQ